MIVENEVRQRLEAASSEKKNSARTVEEIEILLRPNLDLDVQFAICHRENSNVSGTKSSHLLPNNSGLGSIASSVHVSADNRVVLSEDSSLLSSLVGRSPSHHEAAPNRLRKSHSSDDIGTFLTANGLIVEKPIVKEVLETCPEEYRHIQVGDVLEAIDGIATGTVLCWALLLCDAVTHAHFVCAFCVGAVLSVDRIRRCDGVAED